MHTIIEHSSCGEVETLGYFRLSDMRNNDKNVATERVSNFT